MPKVIVDTGPVLHLYEIGRLEILGIFDHVVMPDLVVRELWAYGLAPSDLSGIGMNLSIIIVERAAWGQVMSQSTQLPIHPADAQVFVLAQASQFQEPVLTDDLSLRRRLEDKGATVVGSIGVLVRAYTTNRLKRDELESAVDALFTSSTLHMSRAF